MPDQYGVVLARTIGTSPFSMLGITWGDPSARLAAPVEIRTKAVATGQWSAWLRLDGDDSRGEETARRGGTDPVWVGPSDGAEVRIVADAAAVSALPEGLRLDLIDPGPGEPDTPATTWLPPTAAHGVPVGGTAARPPITSRAGWGADESISPEPPGYLPGQRVKAVVVHHTAESNDYTCADAPAVVRAIYTYHVRQLGWKDIGYNFLVDRCGTVYEGRKGGVDQPVMGAHAYGFNTETTGIAVLGDYTSVAPSQAALAAVSELAGWKLSLHGVKPNGITTLTAGDAGRNYFGKTWSKGAQLSFPTIHGHRDGYNTQCPGDQLYAQLPTIRALAAGAARLSEEREEGWRSLLRHQATAVSGRWGTVTIVSAIALMAGAALTGRSAAMSE
ncbi:peptidoglycan recognition protein [Streptomyces sp. NPDC002838]|uniref:peptidoglycan recognition protein family protein n=1 Tax=Streptomyces sp. NPDC002838 TaxID=3154436 RepID=UPI0033286C6E